MMLTKYYLRFFSATALAVAMYAVAAAQEFSATAEEVAEWRVAAEQGNVQAQISLANAYFYGLGIIQNNCEAVNWWRKAAEQEDVRAQTSLANAYYDGLCVTKDYQDAVTWYRKAANQGYAQAQYHLGSAYYLGHGVAEDKRETVRWFRKAAEQEHAEAQYLLGFAYYLGHDVAEDKREAVRWFRKAAAQGYAEAQYYLGVAYWNGEGIIADVSEAYIWAAIAKVGGHEKASEELRTTKWHDYLTQSEIRSAQKEAARRLEEIDRSIAQNKQNSSAQDPIAGNFALAPAPKSDNPAARVFEKTWRSVVVVVNGDSQGSGVIIRPNIVATNCHVVDSGGSVVVYKAAERRADTDTAFSATIRRIDRDKDFCLLDVKNLWGVTVTVRKYDTLIVGEDVYGLGAPQGLDLSLSTGVISQLRERNGNRFIQTDTAISPGSSGGGLFDSDGNLIGITTAKITDESTEGIGFAIPADLVLGD